jgi:hypothetical protein
MRRRLGGETQRCVIRILDIAARRCWRLRAIRGPSNLRGQIHERPASARAAILALQNSKLQYLWRLEARAPQWRRALACVAQNGTKPFAPEFVRFRVATSLNDRQIIREPAPPDGFPSIWWRVVISVQTA